MIYENEVIMFMLGLGVLIFVVLNYFHLKRIPSFGVLLVGFCILVVAWWLTVLEGFFREASFWYSSVNFLEHLCYAVSGIVVAIWCWSAFGRVKEGR